MPAPNLFLIYVTDIERSTTFYSDLFDIDPNFTSLRYVAFEVAPGVLFAIWNGHEENISPDTPRTSEIGTHGSRGQLPPSTPSTRHGSRRACAWSRNHTTKCSAATSWSPTHGNLIRVSPVD